jgi:hypothetical protein
VLSAFGRFDARICRFSDCLGLLISLLSDDLRFFGEGVGSHFESLSSKAPGLLRLIGENVRLLVKAIGVDARLVLDRSSALIRVSPQPVRLLLFRRSLTSSSQGNHHKSKRCSHPYLITR